MNIFKNFIHLIYKKNAIEDSQIERIYTRYGIFQVKAYKDDEKEYLVFMSQDFFDLKSPIMYIHSGFHACESTGDHTCYCDNQMVMALKILHKEGGLITYHSKDGKNIDGLLQEINARKLENKKNVTHKKKRRFRVKVDNTEYRILGFIVKDLNLTTIKLVSNDTKAIDFIEQLGVEITKKVSTVITYGGQ